MAKFRISPVVRYCLIVAIIIATITFFGFYIIRHPEVVRALRTLDPVTLLLLAIGYSCFTIANAIVLYYSLHFIKKDVPIVENIVLTGYSSIVNFFGPLQSGPGFRAVYLKKKHRVKLRDFFITTLIFYGFFALINGSIILIAALVKFSSPVLYAVAIPVAFLGLGAASILVRKSKRAQELLHRLRFKDRNLWFIGLGALGLILASIATYFVEIHHVNSSISIVQAAIYTAAANLALFVSLTPGAIGIRESFLVLSQQLHGIDTTTIVAASVIDRAFYVGFLALLFVVLLLVNSRRHLAIFQSKASKPAADNE